MIVVADTLCPVCASEDVGVGEVTPHRKMGQPGVFRPVCDECGANGPEITIAPPHVLSISTTMSESMAAWNRCQKLRDALGYLG